MAHEKTQTQALLTAQEFAELTRRTPGAVRAAIQRGELPAHKLGSRRWFIRWSDVDRMFETVGKEVNS